MKEETAAAHAGFNGKPPFAFADIKADTARAGKNDAASSGPNPIHVGAAPDASSSPPAPLDRALARMLTAQSRFVEKRAEKLGKQRLFGHSMKSRGGLM